MSAFSFAHNLLRSSSHPSQYNQSKCFHYHNYLCPSHGCLWNSTGHHQHHITTSPPHANRTFISNWVLGCSYKKTTYAGHLHCCTISQTAEDCWYETPGLTLISLFIVWIMKLICRAALVLWECGEVLQGPATKYNIGLLARTLLELLFV